MALPAVTIFARPRTQTPPSAPAAMVDALANMSIASSSSLAASPSPRATPALPPSQSAPPPSSSQSAKPLNPVAAPFSPSGAMLGVASSSAAAASAGSSSVAVVEPGEEPDPDAQMLEALRGTKDRIFVLKLGEAIEALIADRATRTSIECPAQTTYQRLLIHRTAGYYRLAPEADPVTKILTLSLTVESKV